MEKNFLKKLYWINAVLILLISSYFLGCTKDSSTTNSVVYKLDDTRGTWSRHSIATANSSKGMWIQGSVINYNDSMHLSVFLGPKTGQNYNFWDTVARGGAFNISAEGEITATYDNAAHTFLSTDKNLMVSTTVRKDIPWMGLNYTMTIDQKKNDNTTYSASDLAGTWQANYLVSGGSWSGWVRNTAVIDATGAATLSNVVKSDGTSNAGTTTFEINSKGDVTSKVDSNFFGFLSADKNLLVANMTDGGNGAGLVVAQKTISGTSFTLADLTGKWQFHSHRVGAESYTEHGEISIDANGVVTYTKLIRDNGTTPALPGASTVTVSATGSFVLGADLNGFVSSDKKLMVGTKGTKTEGSYAMTVFQKMR